MKNIFFKLFLTGLFLGSPLIGHSEYRVYQYYVKPKYNLPQDLGPYLVTSTLDPVSYVSYHGGNSSIEVNLLRTWMCKGYTGNKKYCRAPLELQVESTLPEEDKG